VMMGRLDHDGPDRGDPLARRVGRLPGRPHRITDQFVDADVRNPVIITGDWHSTFVNDIRRDFDRPALPSWRRSSSGRPSLWTLASFVVEDGKPGAQQI